MLPRSDQMSSGLSLRCPQPVAAHVPPPWLCHQVSHAVVAAAGGWQPKYEAETCSQNMQPCPALPTGFTRRQGHPLEKVTSPKEASTAPCSWVDLPKSALPIKDTKRKRRRGRKALLILFLHWGAKTNSMQASAVQIWALLFSRKKRLTPGSATTHIQSISASPPCLAQSCFSLTNSNAF